MKAQTSPFSNTTLEELAESAAADPDGYADLIFGETFLENQMPAAVDETASLLREDMEAVVRGQASAGYFLEIDGVNCGVIESPEGGNPRGEVIEIAGGTETFTKKHIGSVRFEPFIVRLGLAAASAVYDWIAAAWQAQPLTRRGAILAADAAQRVINRREFEDALITEVTVPTLDASSSDMARMIVKFVPGATRFQGGSGTITADRSTVPEWLARNFRLEIDGLDGSRVRRVESFTVATPQLASPPNQAPEKVSFPNLQITVSESGAQTWFDWFEDFLVRGNNSPQHEKNGTLTFLASDLHRELGSIRLINLGIFRLRAEPVRADGIRKLTAELYCERMELNLPGVARVSNAQ